MSIQDNTQDKNDPRDQRDFATPPISFGEALYKERDRLKLSQAKLAERLSTPNKKVSQQAVARWERNEVFPRQDSWAKLIEIFGQNSILNDFARRGTFIGRIKSAILDYNTNAANPPVSDDVRRFFESSIKPGLQANQRLEASEEIRALISTKYQSRFDFPTNPEKRSSLRADYLSDKFVFEFKVVGLHGWNMQAVKLGIYQLQKIRRLLNDTDQRTYVLMLIGPPGTYNFHRFAFEESNLFNIYLLHPDSFRAAAQQIEIAETDGIDELFAPDPDDRDDY